MEEKEERLLIVRCQLTDGKRMIKLECHQRNEEVKINGENVMREDISIALMHHSINYLWITKKNTIILCWRILAEKHFNKLQKTYAYVCIYIHAERMIV